MQKKIYRCAIMLILLSNILAGSVYGEELDCTAAWETVEQFDLLVNGDFKNRDTVTRFECISSCMRAAGFKGEVQDTPIIEQDYWGISMEQLFFKDNFSGDPVMRYYLLVAQYNSVALGEKIGCENYFFPERAVTFGEAATFMVRFLEDVGYYRTAKFETPEEAVQLAKEKYGLIREGDPFYEDSDALITPDYFCVMLERFLNQKMYKYFNDRFFWQLQEIWSGATGTYAEYLSGEYSPLEY